MASISDAKKELKQIRQKFYNMNPTQLTSFFKPFTADQLMALRKALDKAIDSKKKELIDAKVRQIVKLQKEVDELKERR